MKRWISLIAFALAFVACADVDETPATATSATAAADPQAVAPGTPDDPLPGTTTVAGTPAPPPGPDPLFQTGAADPAPRVSANQIAPHVRSGQVIVLDVRNEAGFALEHAAGAVHIPLEELGMRAGELPRGKPVIAYCT